MASSEVPAIVCHQVRLPSADHLVRLGPRVPTRIILARRGGGWGGCRAKHRLRKRFGLLKR